MQYDARQKCRSIGPLFDVNWINIHNEFRYPFFLSLAHPQPHSHSLSISFSVCISCAPLWIDAWFVRPCKRMTVACWTASTILIRNMQWAPSAQRNIYGHRSIEQRREEKNHQTHLNTYPIHNKHMLPCCRSPPLCRAMAIIIDNCKWCDVRTFLLSLIE